MWLRRGCSGRVAALQIGVTERRVRVGSSSVEGSVTNVLPQLTKCRAERVRMAWYGVVTAINTSPAADTGVSVPGQYLDLGWAWVQFATRRQVVVVAGCSVMYRWCWEKTRRLLIFDQVLRNIRA